MAKLLVIEGLDGSGKTRLAKWLVNNSKNFCRVSKWRLDWFRPTVERQKVEDNPQGYWNTFYPLTMLAMLEMSDKIRQEDENKVIVACKWLAGEAAINELFVGSKGIPEIGLDYHTLPIVEPDAVIYLKPPFDVRIKRMYERRKAPNQLDMITMTPNSEDIMSSYIRNFYDGKKVHTINNDQPFELTTQQVQEILTCS